MSIFNSNIDRWVQGIVFSIGIVMILALKFCSDEEGSKDDIINEENIVYEDNTATIQTKFSVSYYDNLYNKSILTTSHYIYNNGVCVSLLQYNDTIPELGVTDTTDVYNAKKRLYDFFITVN